MKASYVLIIIVLFMNVLPAYATVFEEWATGYNGPGDSEDKALAIAVDPAGNVYVTGYSWSGSNVYTSDYLTIKYDTNGNQQWSARYDGAAHYEDRAHAIAVDSAGNVYVTGQSMNTSATYDYATVKYNVNGAQQWVSRYNGTGNDDDIAWAITVNAGNVYVTGESYVSDANYYDYATVKYNASGVQQWVSRYDGPNHVNEIPYAVKVDLSGNVYVTGESGGFRFSGGGFTYYGHDYATVKYNSGGGQVWVKRYNGPAAKDDYARDLVLDSSGSAYVTGMSRSSDGLTFDYATIKYTTGGSQSWVSRYNRTGNDEAYRLAIDSANNVYVTGLSEGTGTGFDYATVKYNSTGAQQWVAFYNGPLNGDDEAQAISLDTASNVYVTGLSEGAGTGLDYATVKYNSGGVQQWAAFYNGPVNGDDEASAIASDSSGNAYVTGYVPISASDFDYATVKYSTCAGSARIAGTTPSYYTSLQDAYNAAVTGETIQGQDYVFVENLLFNTNKSVILEAGYNCNYSTNPGITTVIGGMIISNGSVTIQSGTLEVQ